MAEKANKKIDTVRRRKEIKASAIIHLQLDLETQSKRISLQADEFVRHKNDTHGRMMRVEQDLNIEIGKRLDNQKQILDRLNEVEKLSIHTAKINMEVCDAITKYNSKPWYKRLFSKI